MGKEEAEELARDLKEKNLYWIMREETGGEHKGEIGIIDTANSKAEAIKKTKGLVKRKTENPIFPARPVNKPRINPDGTPKIDSEGNVLYDEPEEKYEEVTYRYYVVRPKFIEKIEGTLDIETQKEKFG